MVAALGSRFDCLSQYFHNSQWCQHLLLLLFHSAPVPVSMISLPSALVTLLIQGSVSSPTFSTQRSDTHFVSVTRSRYRNNVGLNITQQGPHPWFQHEIPLSACRFLFSRLFQFLIPMRPFPEPHQSLKVISLLLNPPFFYCFPGSNRLYAVKASFQGGNHSFSFLRQSQTYLKESRSSMVGSQTKSYCHLSCSFEGEHFFGLSVFDVLLN